MKYKNLCKKYGLTEAEIKAGLDILAENLGKIGEWAVIYAVCDLLKSGDIKEKKPTSATTEISSQN